MNWSTIPLPGASDWGKALAEWREKQSRGEAAPRERKGRPLAPWLSQAELAKVLGVSPRTVKRWEVNQSAPDAEAIARIEALRSGGPEAVKALAQEQVLKKF